MPGLLQNCYKVNLSEGPRGLRIDLEAHGSSLWQLLQRPPTKFISLLFPLQRVRWARALYDFEALEEDELGFRSGEVVEVLDSSNPSWWTGRLHNKLGLFPANYVAPMMR